MPPSRTQRPSPRVNPTLRTPIPTFRPTDINIDHLTHAESRRVLNLFTNRTIHQRLSTSTSDVTPLLTIWTQFYDIATRGQEVMETNVFIVEGALRLLRSSQSSFEDARRYALDQFLTHAPPAITAPPVIDLTTDDEVVDLTNDLINSVGIQVPERPGLADRLSDPMELKSPSPAYEVHTAPPSPVTSPKTDDNPFSTMALGSSTECSTHTPIEHQYDLAASTCESYTCPYCHKRAPGHIASECNDHRCPSCGQQEGHDDECAAFRVFQQRVLRRIKKSTSSQSD